MNYKFACGCSFKQFDTVVKDCDGLPPIEIDYYNLPECSEVWPMLATGKTKGVFQLEKSLGKHWCKELYPENIHHLAALASILRPGILESIVDDKSLTQHYCDNKNKRQEVIPMHPALEKILEDTQQIIIFQEQILLIAKEIAGFTGVEADTLRRGIGHKDAKVVFEMEKKFIDGCVRVGKINKQDAKNIFEIIKKSARYSFNASHAYAYGTIGYWTAYTKCLSEDTIVETKDGNKKIKNVLINEYVKAPGKNCDEFVLVTDKINQGIQEMYEITLESGKTIECTMNHKFLCEDGIIRELNEIIECDHKIQTQS